MCLIIILMLLQICRILCVILVHLHVDVFHPCYSVEEGDGKILGSLCVFVCVAFRMVLCIFFVAHLIFKNKRGKASVSHWLQICEALTLCCMKVTFHSEFTSIFLFKPNCYLIVLCCCDVLVALLCCTWICWDIFPPPAYPPDSHP